MQSVWCNQSFVNSTKCERNGATCAVQSVRRNAYTQEILYSVNETSHAQRNASGTSAELAMMAMRSV
eukprot:1727252-Pyramimonas_sp.AAC.1